MCDCGIGCNFGAAAILLNRSAMKCAASSFSPFVLIAAAIACGGSGGGSPTAPSSSKPVLAESVETAHHTFRFAPGDSVDAQWQEAYHEWAVGVLDVQNIPRVTYNKYTSRAHMGEVIGVSNTNGWADAGPFAIHTIWARDNHEVVHLYTSLFGRPVALFSEGIAVAHQTDPARSDFVPRWSGVPVHDRARQFRAQGTLVPIAQLAETRGFRSFSDAITYPESGSFVRFLIDRHGLAPMKRLFAALQPDSSAALVERAVLDSYGATLAALEAQWLEFLNGA